MDIITDLNNVKNNKNKIYLTKRSSMQIITYTVYQEKKYLTFTQKVQMSKYFPKNLQRLSHKWTLCKSINRKTICGTQSKCTR